MLLTCVILATINILIASVRHLGEKKGKIEQ